jgi:hypothetical protein
MDKPSKKALKKRIIQAWASHGSTIPGKISDFILDKDKYVELIWTHFSTRKSAVTGYKIVKRKSPKDDLYFVTIPALVGVAYRYHPYFLIVYIILRIHRQVAVFSAMGLAFV